MLQETTSVTIEYDSFARRPRTIPLCHFYLNGRCRYGDKCKFLHNNTGPSMQTPSTSPAGTGITPMEIDPQPAVEHISPEERNDGPVRNVKMCLFAKAGKCKWGDMCRYSHDLQKENQGLQTKVALGDGAQWMPSENTDTAGDAEMEFMATHEERVEEDEAAARKEIEERVQEERKSRQIALEAQRLQAAHATMRQVVLGSNLVTCGAGIAIKEIVCGFDLSRLTIKNLPRNTRQDEVTALFIQQGVDSESFFLLGMKPNGGQLEAAVLVKADQGETISTALDDVEFGQSRLVCEVTASACWDSMGSSSAHAANLLTVFWRAPSATMIVTYDTMEQARAKARELDQKMFQGRRVKAVINQPPIGRGLRHYNPASVKLMGFPPGTSAAEVTAFIGVGSVWALKSPIFDLQESIDVVRQHLEDLPGVVPGSLVFVQSLLEANIRVKVRFDTWEEAKHAYDTLENKRLRANHPFLRASLPKPLHYTITISQQQYRSQRRQWESLIEAGKKRGAQVQINEGTNDRVFIKVDGDDKKAVGALKVRVESLVGGERLDATHWHASFFSNDGYQFLQQVNTRTGASIRVDKKIRALKVYGDEEMVGEAKEIIKDEVDRLTSLEWTINLKRQSVGFFVREGLPTLKEVLGEDNVRLDLASIPCKLVIKGGDEARHHLNRLIEQSFSSFDRIEQDHATRGRTETCPICYDDVSHPEQLGCGHTYCTACLRHYVMSAPETKIFPLVCIGNEATCRIPIAIPTIQKFLTPQRFNHLIEVAFTSYLDEHPQELKYCTTPDCSQIYRSDTNKTILQCPSCFSTICPSCHEESHEGMTCEQRKLQGNLAEEERLNGEWALAHGVKKCPSCNVWIEKTAGCNHMTCKCGAHICWKCMGVFTKDTIYGHLGEEHGGAFDAAPQVVPPPDDILGPAAGREEFLAAQRAEYLRLQFIRNRPEAEGWQRQRDDDARQREERRRRFQALAEDEARGREELQRVIHAREEQARRAAEEREGGWGCIVM